MDRILPLLMLLTQLPLSPIQPPSLPPLPHQKFSCLFCSAWLYYCLTLCQLTVSSLPLHMSVAMSQCLNTLQDPGASTWIQVLLPVEHAIMLGKHFE